MEDDGWKKHGWNFPIIDGHFLFIDGIFSHSNMEKNI